MFSLPARRTSPQDSCPGALRVHQAADGGLARVRIPGGLLTGRQWQALSAAARELGNGRLELTSRGNLQLRGLAAGAEVALAARLQEAGLLPSLTHERVRNLLASPLTGRDGAGLLDVGPLIAEFDHALCARPELAELSGRFLFALDDGRADVLHARPDIAVTATSADSMRLLLAGCPVGGEVASNAAVALMLAAAEAFLAERRSQGDNAWRLSELVDGPARIAARIGIGIAAQPGIAESTRTDPTPARPAPGPIRQRDGANALVIGVPLGSLSADQAGALVSSRLILTPWRSIVLPDLDTGDLTHLLALCAELGMITNAADPLCQVSACTGRPGCASALADVHADAIATHRSAGTGEPTGAVHWSGCERRCGRPAGAVTDVIATGSGYRVTAGDRLTEVGDSPAEVAAALAAHPALAATR